MLIYDNGKVRINYREQTGSDIGVIKEVYEENCYRFDPAYVKPGGVVIDIGANIGAFSLLVPSKISVLAFEPEPHNFSILQSNLIENKRTNVIAQQVALGYPGKTKVLDLQGGTFMDAEDGIEVKRISINDVKFDRCDFFKIDCEGAEYQIFDDMTDETLKKIKRIAAEFHPFNDEWHRELIARLNRFFELETIHGGIVIGVAK
jgi:FkbM family methyltransferase